MINFPFFFKQIFKYIHIINMDSFGYDADVQSANERAQFIRRQNETINEDNLIGEKDAQQKQTEDDVLGDLNYGKDTLSNLFSGSGIKSAYENRQSRIQRDLRNAKQKAQSSRQQLIEGGDTPPMSGDTPPATTTPTTTPPSNTTTETPDDRPPFVGDEAPTSRQSFSITIGNKKVAPTNLRRSFAVGEKLDANDVFSNALDNDTPTPALEPEPQPEPTQPTPSPENNQPSQAPPDTRTADEPNPPPSEETPPKSGILTKGIQRVTGLAEDDAEFAGRVGGAVTNAAMGGVGVYDGIENLVKSGGKHFFDKGASATDDISEVGNIIAGASDVVGLVPGLEWVAGIGNAIGGIGGIVKMFGDHDKNVAQQNADKYTDKTNITPEAPTSIAQISQSNIRQSNQSASVY